MAQNRESLWSVFLFHSFSLILNTMSIPRLLLKSIKYQHLGLWVASSLPPTRRSSIWPTKLAAHYADTHFSQVLNLKQNLAELWEETEKEPFEQKFLSSENGIYRIPALFPITWNWPLFWLSWHPRLENHLPNWLWYCVACAGRIFWINHYKNSAGLAAIHMDRKANLDS